MKISKKILGESASFLGKFRKESWTDPLEYGMMELLVIGFSDNRQQKINPSGG